MGGGVLSNLFRNIIKGSSEEVANKVASQYSDDVLRTAATSSADDIAAQQGNLIATHQLSPEKLAGVSELGGFVQPSMAVVDPSKGVNFLPGSGFGDIVMVANRSAIDPARRASKAIIGDRDIYSPRFPEASHKPNMDVLDEILAETPGISKQSALSNMGLDDTPVYSPFAQDLFKKQNPQYAKTPAYELRELPEFQQFADETLGRLRGEKMLDYRTPSGNYKQMPYTAENASKIMNKSATVGGESGWQTPTSAAYHQNTKKFSSLDDAYKNKHRLIDSTTGEVTKDAMSSRMTDLANKIDQLNLEMFQDSNPYFRQDAISNYIADAVSGKKDLYPALADLPKELVDEIAELSLAYKNVPVSYFEAKPRRVVGGEEFFGAYIPKDSSPEVIEQLQRLGVENIRKYLDPADLDLQLAILAKEGKRGKSPYVLGLGGALPTAGVLSSLFANDQPIENAA